MRTFKEVRRYFETTLQGELSALEQERKKILRQLLRSYAIIAVIVLMIGIGVLLILKSGKGFSGAVLGAIPVAEFVKRSLLWRYKSRFKKSIIGELIKFLDPRLYYAPESCLPQSELEESRLFFRGKIKSYRGDDYVSGSIGSTAIRFSEMHVEFERGMDFTGLFFVADFNKNFSGRTVVLPISFGRKHITHHKLQRNDAFGTSVLMDDPFFNKEFCVNSSDQIEARYILTHSLMRRIVGLKKKIGLMAEIRLSFVQSHMYMALSYDKSLFEPDIYTTMLDFKAIKTYYRDLKTALDIIEDLNLNTRIWSKE